MLRRALTLALAVAIAGTPAALVAQAPSSLGSISGRAVTAVGGGVGSQRVELLQGTHVVDVATTNAFGDWAFRGVAPGEYVVRATVKGRVAGVRVTLVAGQAATGTLIVVPTASVSPQLGLVANFISLVPAMSATVAAAAASVVTDTETTELDEVILKDILEALPPAERQAFAASVIAAVQANPNTPSPFAQYQAQFVQIVINPTVVPTFPPPQPQAS